MANKRLELETKAFELSQKIRVLCEEYKADYSVVATLMLEDGSGYQKLDLLDVSKKANKPITETLVAQIRDLSGGVAFVMTPYIPAMNQLNDLCDRIADQQDDALTLNEKHDKLIEAHQVQANTIESLQKLRSENLESLMALRREHTHEFEKRKEAEAEVQKLLAQAEELRQQLAPVVVPQQQIRDLSTGAGTDYTDNKPKSA